MCVTDLPSVIAYQADGNVRRNNAALGGVCRVAALDWQEFCDSQGVSFPDKFQLVVASDCVWLSEFLDIFVRTVTLLVRRGATALVAQTERAIAGSRVFCSCRELEDAFVGAGLAVETVKQEADKYLWRVTLA